MGKKKTFSCGSAGKEFLCNAGDMGLISGLGRSPGEEKGYPLQYSDLENSLDCTVHGVAENWTRQRFLLLGFPSDSAGKESLPAMQET